ncbi:MAG: VTT domain-containing protein [Colwellia sp.]|nr:VTT domain-containing protein [Colwellia sp.]
MKSLIKIIAIMATCFAITFIIVKFTGILTIDQIEIWLTHAQNNSILYVAVIICLLLFCDLFIAIPTLTVTIFSGYFLGHIMGAVVAFTGMFLAGICGYGLSRYYGEKLLTFLVKDQIKRSEAIKAFEQHGFVMILLSRALPILPEVSACLSGMTGMPIKKFIFAWLMSTLPYVLIATFVGSISSFDNPKPAIYGALGISLFLWTAWYCYHRKVNNQK